MKTHVSSPTHSSADVVIPIVIFVIIACVIVLVVVIVMYSRNHNGIHQVFFSNPKHIALAVHRGHIYVGDRQIPRFVHCFQQKHVPKGTEVCFHWSKENCAQVFQIFFGENVASELADYVPLFCFGGLCCLPGSSEHTLDAFTRKIEEINKHKEKKYRDKRIFLFRCQESANVVAVASTYDTMFWKRRFYEKRGKLIDNKCIQIISL